MNEKLLQGLSRIGLKLDETQLKSLDTYMNCVMEFNKSYNIMKADTLDELAVNHVLDTLVAVPAITNIIEEIRKNGTQDIIIGDIGAGGGCPGLPLATAFPEIKFELVERMDKRCTFLEDTVLKMGLKNVRIRCVQADNVEGNHFDLEVFRAFHPFDTKITKLLMSMLKKGGYIAAYKAREEKIIAEMDAIKMMVPSYKKIKLTVPFLEDHERNLVVIQK